MGERMVKWLLRRSVTKDVPYKIVSGAPTPPNEAGWVYGKFVDLYGHYSWVEVMRPGTGLPRTAGSYDGDLWVEYEVADWGGWTKTWLQEWNREQAQLDPWELYGPEDDAYAPPVAQTHAVILVGVGWYPIDGIARGMYPASDSAKIQKDRAPLDAALAALNSPCGGG